MRCKLVMIAIITACSIPAVAARMLTVEQLQYTLVAARSAHQSDVALARELNDLKLTSRLTGSDLQRLLADSPGPKTTESINAIAGASAFLDPPPNELPPTPSPDFASQRAIVAKTIDYAIHTLPSLPNFLATRVTAQYVDGLRGLSLDAVPRGGLFLVGNFRAPIAFRDGHETDDPAISARLTSSERKAHGKDEKGASPQSAVHGLVSWGEFGPILSVVLLDAAKGKLSWARWQQEDGKSVAVFKFSVDRAVSHYTLSYCCETSMSTENDPAAGRVSWKPGYHGLLEIDPQTGTILRITIEADLRQDDPIQHASMMVEYGPVKIGDSLRICPTRSVSSSVARAEYYSHSNLESTDRMLLNAVEFVDYRRFGSESTILTELPPSAGNDTLPAPAPQETVARNTPEQPAPTSEPPAPTQPSPSAAAISLAPQPEAGREIQTTSVESLDSLFTEKSKPAGNAAPKSESASFTMKVTTRSVDVDLVATDKHGKPVTDLKQDQIALFDNGRQQQLRDFFHATPAPTSTPAAASVPAPAAAPQTLDTFTNTTSPASQSKDAADLLILLLDESHLAFLDLNRSREEVLRFLAAARPTSRIALYSMSEQGFRVIQDVTQDHAQVISRLKSWTPDVQAVSQSQAQPSKPSSIAPLYDAGESLDTSDVQGSATGTPVAILSGNLPLRYALQGLMALARHFASVPGRKSIAWISGDAALASWSGMKGNPQLEAAIQHTHEALNEARIVLYAIDASSSNVGPGGFDASVINPNGDPPPIQNGPMGPRLGVSATPVQQEALGIQAPARELAESTGGRAVNKGGDLKNVLEGIDRDSDSYYELAFDPDTPADGKFHFLVVKAPSRKNVVLRYRTGYLYSEESATTRQRFQQSLWSPQDASGIALTAEAVSAADAPSGKSTVRLRISFPGLALEQKDGRWTDQVYVFVAVRDDAAQKAEVSGDTMRLALNQTSYDSGFPAGIPYQRAVEVHSKLGSVRVIVVDGNSGRLGSVTLPASALLP